MVAPVNDFDIRLQAENPRTLAPRGGIVLSATANTITIDGSGAPSSSIITLVATPLSVVGTVAFTTSPTVPLTVDTTGRIATLHYSDMGTGSVVVTATLTAAGIAYSDSRTITQVSIGSLGYQGALDATRNNTAQGLVKNRPAGKDGDFYFATDELKLYQKISGAWQVAGNNFTSTNQLTDDAGLGTTAYWAGVSGTGKPQDNATVGANASNFTGTLGGDNLMNNSSFEVMSAEPRRPAGYKLYNNANIATAYIDIAGRLGGKAFAIRAGATGATEWGLYSSQAFSDSVAGGITGGWQPGKTYVVSFKARKVGGASWGAMVLQWNQAPATTAVVSNPSLNTSWQTYTFRITWGASVEAQGHLYIDRLGATAVNDELHIDELMVQEGDVYSEWFPSAREAKAAADTANTASFSPYQMWEFRNTLDGWSAGGASLSLRADSVVLTSTSNDPVLSGPTGLSIAGSYDKVRMRLRRTAGSVWQGQLYYSTANHTTSENYTRVIADPTLSGAWVIAEWDMANLTAGGTDWNGSTITSLRLDLGQSSTDVFEIDWIAVGKYGVGDLSAQAALAAISSDNILSKGEKSQVIADWVAIANENAGINASATTLAIGASYPAWGSAYVALYDYIAALSPAWNDVTQDTPIVGSDFRAAFTNYYAAKQTLLNDIAAKAATLASWSSVAGRPDDTSNLILKSSFEDGSPGDWTTGAGAVLPVVAVSGQPFLKALQISSRDSFEYGATFPVVAGETLYAEAYLDASTTAGSVAFGVRFDKSDGTTYSWVAAVAISAGAGWIRTKGSVVVPAGVNIVKATPWLQINLSDTFGTARAAMLRISRYQSGATVGATLGTNVGGQITPANSATLVAPQAIGSVQISDLRTSNYAEDGAGNATAGAKISSTGTALKVANNSLQVGSLVFSDYWFRLTQGIDGSVASGRLIWRGNNDATTRGGAPDINCLSLTSQFVLVSNTGSNGNITASVDTCTFSYKWTPTAYAANTDNLDAMQQIHVQFFLAASSTSPFTEIYQACPSRTYDGAAGAVQGVITAAWRGTSNNSYSGSVAYGGHSPAIIAGYPPGGISGLTAYYKGYMRVRAANTYGWSATRDFGPPPGLVWYETLPDATITGVAGSAGGGSGSSGGACPAPWVKVRLLNGRDISASDLHNGAQLAAVNDSTMEALPRGGIVRDLATIWAQRYRVKMADGTATEWSENHRFAVAERGWVAVQHLRGGDQVLGLKESVVDSVFAVGEGQVVSFRVEGAGTYFAGGLLCHNAKVIS